MDSPFKDGDPAVLDGDHRYQIGRIPVYLSIAVLDGAPRLSMVITASPSGVRYDPPQRVHMATFKSQAHAVTMHKFLDEMTEQINDAVLHWEERCAEVERMLAVTIPINEDESHEQN